MASKIHDVVITNLKVISDERGAVLHMLRCDDSIFNKFGEIYFSIVNHGMVKAWKKHKKMTQHLAVPKGKIRLVIYDDRPESESYEKIEILDIGNDNYCLVKIPPLVWYGFKGISSESAIIANCTDIPYKPEETIKLDLHTDRIPYNWI